jgi:hypothetical protein
MKAHQPQDFSQVQNPFVTSADELFANLLMRKGRIHQYHHWHKVLCRKNDAEADKGPLTFETAKKFKFNEGDLALDCSVGHAITSYSGQVHEILCKQCKTIFSRA